MGALVVPQVAIELAKRFEGFERRVKRGIEITAVPYICPAGFWTIGYGHLCDSKHLPITEAEAEVYLARDLQTALAATVASSCDEPDGRVFARVVCDNCWRPCPQRHQLPQPPSELRA